MNQHGELQEKAAQLIELHGEVRLLEDLSSGMRQLIPNDDDAFAAAVAERLAGPSFQPKTISDMVTFSTGIPSVDAIFSRAVLSGGNLIEVHGASSSGKTQFCLQTCAHNAGSIYVMTSGRFPIRRYEQLTGADSLSTIIESVGSVSALEHWCSTRLPYLMREMKPRVIVVDSIASLYRPAFEHGAEIARANSFVKVVAAIKNAALVSNAVIIAVNQVAARPGLLQPVPALGHAWGRCCNIRLELSRKERRNNVRRLRVVHSSFVPYGTTAYFQITENAIIDAELHEF